MAHHLVRFIVRASGLLDNEKDGHLWTTKSHFYSTPGYFEADWRDSDRGSQIYFMNLPHATSNAVQGRATNLWSPAVQITNYTVPFCQKKRVPGGPLTKV